MRIRNPARKSKQVLRLCPTNCCMEDETRIRIQQTISHLARLRPHSPHYNHNIKDEQFYIKTFLSQTLLRIVYPGSRSNFFHPGSRILIRIKEFNYFNPKNCFNALGIIYMIRDVYPWSRIRILIFYPSRIQGSIRHRIRIRNTGLRSGFRPFY